MLETNHHLLKMEKYIGLRCAEDNLTRARARTP
jgi:hypothetical protein